MKMINEFENDSCGKIRSTRGKKLKVNLMTISKNTGLLNIRDQIILQHEEVRPDRKNSLIVRNINDK